MRGVLELPRWLQRPLADMVADHHSLDFTEHGPQALAWHLSQSFGELVVLELGPAGFERMTGLLGDPFDESSRLVRRLTDALKEAYVGGTTWLKSQADGDFLAKLFVNALSIRFVDVEPVEAPLMARPRLERAIGKVFDAISGTNAPPQDVALMFAGAMEDAAKRMRLDAVIDRIEALHRGSPPLIHIVANRMNELRSERDGVWRCGKDDCARAFFAFAEVIGLELVDRAPQSVLISASDARAYDPSTRFGRGDTLAHASFGVGVVLSASPTAIEVAFPKGKKKLVHGRGD